MIKLHYSILVNECSNLIQQIMPDIWPTYWFMKRKLIQWWLSIPPIYRNQWNEAKKNIKNKNKNKQTNKQKKNKKKKRKIPQYFSSVSLINRLQCPNTHLLIYSFLWGILVRSVILWCYISLQYETNV